MSWADTVKATALAVAAECKSTAEWNPVDAPWQWQPRDSWLARFRQPREFPLPVAANRASSTTHQS